MNLSDTYGRRNTINHQDGFSLLEVVLSMFMLGLFVLIFTKGLTHAKYTAEDNLYESTSLTIAVSTIEQMKGTNTNLLENPPVKSGKKIFEMIVEGGESRDLILDEVNAVTVPLISEDDGSVSKTLNIEMTPSIEQMTTADGYWLTIHYSYQHPHTGRVRTNTVRNAMSTIAN